jgi:hypothetical protein
VRLYTETQAEVEIKNKDGGDTGNLMRKNDF